MKTKLMIGCAVMCLGMSGLLQAEIEDVSVIDDSVSYVRLSVEKKRASKLIAVFQTCIEQCSDQTILKRLRELKLIGKIYSDAVFIVYLSHV